MTNPMLEVRNLSAGYGETTVLWDVSLQVQRGTVAAILGANGAGKTTLLRALSGLLPISKGEIWVDGRPVTGQGAPAMVRLGVAHVPEGRQLFAGLSVKDNLVSGAFCRQDTANIARDYAETLELFPELKKLLGRQAGLLSGGEQQMVAIGRGLMSRPSLLLVDEFSLGLAPVIVDRLADLIARVSREKNLTVVLVEQDVHRALELANWGFVIDNGRVAKSGPARDLLADAELRQIYMGI